MAAPKEIIRLVERFDEHRETYQSPQYNETQLRREFLDPFFEALGWDVENKQGYAAAYKDVIHEDAIKIGGFTKAPDYCFRIGGTRKFFVEAKKPAVDIKQDASPAFQLRRYAWSAKLPLSILTDFEEFALYDCRIKPAISDKAPTGRIKSLTYAEYVEKWDEIQSIFSREAVLKGSFDKYAETSRVKKGTTEVDTAFLKEIESWRDLLARNLALRNPKLNPRELNFAVQRTIDRIIFLRICEDRGIEPYGQLIALLNGSNVYSNLIELYRKADERYNSGLFHFRQEKGRTEEFDRLTLGLVIEDRVFEGIFNNLYYPDSPYEFSVLPADILGQVYEQFLGKVIRLTAGHQAKVEDKPEVKKAGGIFYTPTYIVNYIVRNTVDCLLEGKTPKDVEKITILDPACGSGSFLIGAYQRLLDWHRDWYVNNGKEKWAKGKEPVLYQGPGDAWRLTTSKRKEILLKNIFGVDIDPQAVEVTKLSLLLKVLEGESDQTLASQLILFHERALPDLGSNIKCGNSLIGSDFYLGSSGVLPVFGEEERLRVNVFDWDKEFPRIFRGDNPGFDVVIGNPPYGYMIPENEQQYYKKYYKHQDYQKDLYLLFLERYEYLLNLNALLGVIVSNTWMQSVTYKNIRKYLSNNYLWLNILNLDEKVFKAIVDTHVLIFKKSLFDSCSLHNIKIFTRKDDKILFSHEVCSYSIQRDGNPINVISSLAEQDLILKIKKKLPLLLSDICNVYNGIKPFEIGKGNPPQSEKVVSEKPYVREGVKPGKNWVPLLRGKLIQKYINNWNNNYWVLYGPWLAAPRDPMIFNQPIKIMVRQTGDSIIATIIEKGFIARNNIHIILPKLESYSLCYILGIINSKLMDFIYTFMNPEKGEALAEVKKEHVESLPIRSIDFFDPPDTGLHDRMVKLVDLMLSLHRKLAATNTGHEKTALQRQIDITDDQINQLVYELYDLSNKDIQIVEKN